MQVYGLVGQTEEGIWPKAQLLRSDQPVCELAFCPKGHIFSVRRRAMCDVRCA